MTYNEDYTQRLVDKQLVRWKSLLDVQAPYRWHIRRLKLGRTLDIGCGIGRCLAFLDDAIGIDVNESSIDIARSRGLNAMTMEDFAQSDLNKPHHYDSLLFAHVAEHVGVAESTNILKNYTGLLKSDGRLVIITPQEAGYKSDQTHVEFIDFEKQRAIIEQLGLALKRQYSFPFPKIIGRVFLYNEFVTIAHVN